MKYLYAVLFLLCCSMVFANPTVIKVEKSPYIFQSEEIPNKPLREIVLFTFSEEVFGSTKFSKSKSKIYYEQLSISNMIPEATWEGYLTPTDTSRQLIWFASLITIRDRYIRVTIPKDHLIDKSNNFLENDVSFLLVPKWNITDVKN